MKNGKRDMHDDSIDEDGWIIDDNIDLTQTVSFYQPCDETLEDISDSSDYDQRTEEIIAAVYALPVGGKGEYICPMCGGTADLGRLYDTHWTIDCRQCSAYRLQQD